MQSQADELRQPTTIEEETASRDPEPAAEPAAEARVEAAHQDNQTVMVQDPENTPVNPKAVTSDTTQLYLPEATMPAPAEISVAIDESTPLLATKPVAPKPVAVAPKAQETPRLPKDAGREMEEPIPSIYEVEEVTHHKADSLEPDIATVNEVIFDDEVMDTFERLAELVYTEPAYTKQEETPAFDAEQRPILTEDQLVLLNPETPESPEPSAFEEFVMAQAVPETSPDLDAIIASSNEQTLEETFVQLNFYLAETSPDQDPESPDIPVIEEALRDLVELLPANNIDDAAEKEQEERVTITPELTQKLLTLLRAVGYDNPREALLQFIDRHNFEFLLQAIHYLYRLCDEDNRQELLYKQAGITVSGSDEPLTIRLGRAIISLITRPGIPETAVND